MSDPGTMTREEREAFLAAVHVGVLAVDELGAWYVEYNPRTEDSRTVRLRPERWRTFDFAKLF